MALSPAAAALSPVAFSERKLGKPSRYEKCLEEVREAYTDDYRIELIARLRKEASVQITLP